LDRRVESCLNELIERYPRLLECKDSIYQAYEILRNSYINGGKLLIAGNGGSAADSQHIVGELMKSFKIRRPLEKDIAEKIRAIDNERGSMIVDFLESPLPAISLVTHSALTTAYLNDVGVRGIFAQQVLGYGDYKDVFLGISTSGNSKNILYAAVVAKACGLHIIGLTGEKESKMMNYADVCIRVPETETFMVQELHLPVYHCLCLMLESRFFEN